MINELKKVLLRPYNEQIDDYRVYKIKFEDLQKEIISDESDKIYSNKKEELKKAYKNPKGDLLKEYENKLYEIMVEYKKSLDSFQEKFENYKVMKAKLASWNIYEIKVKMEKINQASSVSELGLTEEQAEKLCNENGIEYIKLNTAG